MLRSCGDRATRDSLRSRSDCVLFVVISWWKVILQLIRCKLAPSHSASIQLASIALLAVYVANFLGWGKLVCVIRDKKIFYRVEWQRNYGGTLFGDR